MSRIARHTAVGLASFGLVGGSLIAAAPAMADHRGDRDRDYREVDGDVCLKYDRDKECKSKTWLDADEWRNSGKSGWRTVKLTADVDFFQKKYDDRRKHDDRNRNDGKSWNDDKSWNDHHGKKDKDLGEVEFQYWDDHKDEWKTFATEDVDKDGKADVKVKIKVKWHDEVDVRAEYSGVDHQIKGSTSNRVEID